MHRPVPVPYSLHTCRRGAQLLRKNHAHIYLRLMLVCYLAELRYGGYSPIMCISVKSPSCTWHTYLQQMKQTPAFTAPLSAPESVAGWINGKVKVQQLILEQLICVTYRHCFITGGSYIINAVPEEMYVLIILCDNCRLPVLCRLAYRIDLANSSDLTLAWRNNSGKLLNIVYRWDDLSTTAGNRRYLCF
jgi:hypothetical protein